MTLTSEEKKAISKYRLEKAERFLEDAELLLREKRLESSINRSYYAVLNAAKSVLILFGIDPKTHEGVKTMVNKKLVMEGFIPKELGKWFRNLLSERENVDYADFAIIELSDAENAFQNAKFFLEKIKEIIAKIAEKL